MSVEHGSSDAAQAPRVGPLALFVLLLGIGSLVFCFPVPGIVAIRLAGRARAQLAASPGALVGGPLIRIGVACAWVSFAFVAVVILVLLGFLALRH